MTRHPKGNTPADTEMVNGEGPSPPDESRGVTIHPRITPAQSHAGSLVAKQRGQRPMTFWSEALAYGLPVAAALGVPDEQGMYGPWSGKRLAQLLRMTVTQLIEFQIQHGEVPAILELLQRQGLSPTAAPASVQSDSAESRAETEVFAASADRKEVQQGLAGVGFGHINILGQLDNR